jgi:hypothetical protein
LIKDSAAWNPPESLPVFTTVVPAIDAVAVEKNKIKLRTMFFI